MTTPTVAEVRKRLAPNVLQHRTFSTELRVNRAAVEAVERDAAEELDGRRTTVAEQTPEQRARKARRDVLARLRALRA